MTKLRKPEQTSITGELQKLLEDLAGTNPTTKRRIRKDVFSLMYLHGTRGRQERMRLAGVKEVQKKINWIAKSASALAKAIEEAPPNLCRAYPSLQRLLALQDTATEIADDSALAVKRIKIGARGRPQSYHADEVEKAASDIFESYTSKRARRWTDADGRACGPYNEFVSKVFDILSIKQKPETTMRRRG